MRQGIGCLLCEANPGSLVDVRHTLEGWRLSCRSIPIAGLAEPHASTDVVVVELAGDQSPTIAALVAGRRAGGHPCLALCDPDDARALSLAASSGFDDVLATPLDPVELVRRLQALAGLAELTAERQRRIGLYAAYRSDAAKPSSAPAHMGPRPSVAVLGRADENQVQVTAALPPASLTYLEDGAGLRAALRGGGIDLLLVTEPALLSAAIDTVEAADGTPPVLVAAHAGPPWALELPAQVDLLSLPAPTPLARARLALALRTAALRRWLREPPLGEARGLLVDGLTGLHNQGAFLDYLRLAGEDRALIGIEHDRLDWINQQAGYAAGNRVLAQMGWSLRRRSRAQDFAGHLGGGRFALAVVEHDRSKLERLRGRLQSTVAEDEPWQLLAAAEPLPIRGAPAQRLARLFADLRRLRPAA
jgi:GGDEF domain-containing protein